MYTRHKYELITSPPKVIFFVKRKTTKTLSYKLGSDGMCWGLGSLSPSETDHYRVLHKLPSISPHLSNNSTNA
jgi:hypothetical protein